MYDFIAKHKRGVQILLALMMLPFMLFGVDWYFRTSDPVGTVATVDKRPISRDEFDQAMRDQAERLRSQMGRQFDPAMLESPEVRFAILDQVINQRLLAAEAARDGIRVNDAQLAQFIAELPPFQQDGKFSPERYRELLRGQNMSVASFEGRVRGDLTIAPLQEPVTNGSIVAGPSAARYLALLEQRRKVAVATLDAEAFAKAVKVGDAEVRAFFDQNPAAFSTPEQVRIEYVVLSPDAIAAQTTVEPAAVRAAYDARLAAYSTPEERSAAHILIAVAADAPQAARDAARQKAEALAKEARANPARFAELAKANSQDPGSATQGGDLGSFARGSMVKPFEDAVFAAKTGDIVGPVGTDFGWHVIRVTGAKPATQRPFDEVKGAIELELKRERAQTKLAAAADQFQTQVFEQADSLAGVAKNLDLQLNTTPLVTRAQVQQLGLGNPKFAEAVFDPASLKDKRNTEAIEVAPGTLIAGRVVEHKPAAPRPFDEVRDEIRRQLERRAAVAAAEQAGRAKLALLEAGKSDKEAGLVFAAPVDVNRNQAGAVFTPDSLSRIFQADPTKLPAYVSGVNPRGGFTIYRVSAVSEPPVTDEARVKLAASRMGEQLGREFLSAYLASLRSRTDVTIDQAALEKR